MSAKTPAVSLSYREGYLYDPATPDRSIRLDTPAWFVWLEEPTTRRFAYPLFDAAKGYIVGVMTVRKERRVRGGAYWTVYRRGPGHLHKVYLGRTSAVTHARLEAIAQLLREATSGGPSARC